MKRLLGTAIALALAAPLFAYANDAYIVSDISLQSGPDQEYPPIGDLQAGTEVDVQGCIEGYSWCDVIVGSDRGWVPGSFVEEEYDNQPVYLVDYGPRIGLPIVTFSIGSYWDAHYHNRPFYGQRTEWVNRHFSPRQPPRPSIAHAPPIPNHGGPNHGEPNHDAHDHGAPPQHDVSHAAPQPDRTRPAPVQTPRPTQNAVANRGEHAPTATHTETTKHTTTTHVTNANAPRPETANQPKTVAHNPPPKPHETKAPPPKESRAPAEHKDDDHGH